MINILAGTKTPLTDIGVAAGICWNAPIKDNNKNVNRALDCIRSGHGRVMEYPDITVSIKGYSARCIRELYTHIIGTTRLQESTRYVDCNAFEYFDPTKGNDKQTLVYNQTMKTISDAYKELLEAGMSKEDAANILPLGMSSGIVLKINARALEHLANMRLCTRAYKEIRQLVIELKRELSKYSIQWRMFAEEFMVPKCKKELFCNESKCCGKALTHKQAEEAIYIYKYNNALNLPNKTYQELTEEIKSLESELEKGKKRWKYFESRFIECSTCTSAEKEKCLMFTEGLCEGERCNELIDLEALIDKAIDKENYGVN